MSALLRKLRADFRRHRLQRFLLVLLLTGAAATISLALSVRDRGDAAWGRLFAETDGAFAWFYGAPGTDLSKVAGDPRVSQATAPYLTSTVGLTHPNPRGGGNAAMPVWLVGFPREQTAIGRVHVTDGRWFGEAPGEVVLDRRMAQELHVRVGDRIAARSAEGDYPVMVVGLGVFPGRSPFSFPSLAWASEQTLRAAGTLDPRGFRTALGVRLADRRATAGFVRDVRAGYPVGALVLAEDWQEVRVTNDDARKVIILFLGVFSVFALLASATVIVNAVGGRVLAEFRDIGVMKAIGFTPGQVMSGFMLEHFTLALIAAVAGTALGIVAAPALDGDSAKAFEIDRTPILNAAVALQTSLVVIAAVIAATFIPAWQAGRISTVRAVARRAGSVSARRSTVAGAARRLHLPVAAVLGLKDVYARPLRAWLTVAALSVTVLTAVFVLVTEATIRELTSSPAAMGEPFDAIVNRAALPAARVEAALAGQAGVGRWFQREEHDASVGDSGGSISAVVVAGDYKDGWILTRGRMFHAPGEAIAGKGFLDEANAAVGDTVSVVFQDRRVVVRIVGQYRDLNDNGKVVMFGLDTVQQQVDPGAALNQWAITLAPGAHISEVVAGLQAAGVPAAQIQVLNHQPEGVDAVRAVLVVLTVLLLGVGLTGLLNTVFFGIRERRRDLAVLKCLGLTPRQAVGGVMAGTALMAAAGAAIGIPAGLLATHAILDIMTNNLGWGTGITQDPPALLLLGLAPALVAASAVVALLPAISAARIPVSEALRSE